MSDLDPEEGFRSPGLQPLKIHYGPSEESPPPFVVNDSKGSGTNSPGGEGTLPCSQPNRPDIANFERIHRPKDEPLPDDPPELPGKLVFPKERPPPPPYGTRDAAPEPVPEPTPKPAAEPPPPEPQSSEDKALKHKATDALKFLLQEPDLQEPTWEDSPKEKTPKDEQTSPGAISTLLSHPDSASPKEEGPLSKYMISAPSQDSLPALHSPDNRHTHTLPPLQAALGISVEPHRIPGSSPYSLPSVTAASPQGLRNEPSWELQRPSQFGPSPVPPSPYSHLSPQSVTDISAVSSPVSHHSYRTHPLKSDIAYLNTPYEASHPAKTPATSYPTPTDHHTPAGACDRTPSFAPPPPSVAGPGGPTGSYKCSHPGCVAAPFQTQYLLNSHAKVHSQDRPHFCPVDGCPRGPGGKGFKRKNEMIRHGLVHNSPGYVCPFCPDQQHKYPRPDNLQRHVRVHHVDKNKDDPLLRQVLAQRPEGSTRGRRRRANAH